VEFEPDTNKHQQDDELLPAYDFSAAVRGKHHAAYQAGGNLVFLEPDIARAFPDSAAVNQALRMLMNLAKEATRGDRRP
jgi:hypothetical protein